MTHEDIMTDT